jgi:hypothetical protein
MGRRLIPTVYSIRNGPFAENVMTSWRFEGSNDMVHWQKLDERSGRNLSHKDLDKLQKPGATSTWGIDFTHENDGFMCFRVVQTDANTSGNDYL